MARDDDIYKRAREVMCRYHGNCHGCLIQRAARDERLTCTEFRKKFPERDRRIVMGWRAANLKTARTVLPDTIRRSD